MRILALDPGPVMTGFCLYDTEAKMVLAKGHDLNPGIIVLIRGLQYDEVAIEMIASYGMAVGAEVFETCVWIGKFIQVCCDEGVCVSRIFRKDCKMYLCGTPRAKDSNIRQAIIDKFGGPDCIKKGGVLHKVSTHVWPALAVALTHEHLLNSQPQKP